MCVCWVGGGGDRRAFLIAPGSSAFSGVAVHFSHPYTDLKKISNARESKEASKAVKKMLP